MQVVFSEEALVTTNRQLDLVIVPVVPPLSFNDQTFLAADNSLFKHLSLARLKEIFKEQDFTGKFKQSVVLYTASLTANGALEREVAAKRLAFFGLGESAEFTQDRFTLAKTFLKLGAFSATLAEKVSAKTAAIILPALDLEESAWLEIFILVTRGALLGSYRFTKYQTKEDKLSEVQELRLYRAGESLTSSTSKPAKASKSPSVRPAAPIDAKVAKQVLREAVLTSNAVKLARDLVNEPSYYLYPAALAAIAKKVAASDSSLTCKIYEEAALKKMRMNLLLGVGMGSERPPCLVHVSYCGKATAAKGRKSGVKKIVLVGKGITFDSGGLCLKSAEGMADMKRDMAGAAAVLAVLQAVSQLKLPLEVHGILALAENMPSGKAIRPGDILVSAAEKTVEINNTDAEGRLVLADALTYAQDLKPDILLDLATLTGACAVALGLETTGVFSNDEELATQFLTAALASGEHMWRLPLTASMREQLDSDIADLKNTTGERFGGAISAALFLAEFVGKTPWLHLDIAPTAASKTSNGEIVKGATGVGVASIIKWLQACSV